jgi:hypothetical protein
MMRVLVSFLALGGCAAPACHPVVERIEVPAVERLVTVPDSRGPNALIAEYTRIQSQERYFILHTGPKHLRALVPLDKAAHDAMRPVAVSDHVATAAEMQRAVDALGSLQAYLSTQKVQ